MPLLAPALLLLAVAVQPSLARPGPECLPRVGPHRWVPQFHLMGPMVRIDGMLWPGDLNDANGILEHRGVFHAMFQTPVWQNGLNGTGQPPACHGDLALCGPHAWAHVVSENGVHWRRLRDILTPTNGSAVDGVDGDCDGTLSFPEGIGPTILFGADCAVPVLPPPPRYAQHQVLSPHDKSSLGVGDAPRVAVARPVNASDRFLEDWAMDSSQNPIVFAESSPPCSFPGRVWRGSDDHSFNLICCINSQQNHWGRYTTTDAKLHGPWSLADPAFAVVANATTGSGDDDPYGAQCRSPTGPLHCELSAGPVGSISSPSFLALPGPPKPGEPTHIINSAGGKAFAVGTYSSTEQRMVNVSRWQQTVDSSAFSSANWFVAGKAESDGRVLTLGDLQAGKQRRGTPNATTTNGVLLTPAWSMTGVRVLHWDGAAAQLVANPPAELAQLRGRQICAEKNIHLKPTDGAHQLRFPDDEGATMDLELEVILPGPGEGEARFDLRVLASASGTVGRATTLRFHVAALPLVDLNSKSEQTQQQMRRSGNLTLLTTRTEPMNCTSAFTVAAGEKNVLLRVVVDRSVVEAFAAGGRAVLTGRDYPAQNETAAYLVTRSGGAGLTFSRVDAWAMGCAWVE